MSTASDLLNIAVAEIGQHEDPVGSNVTKYGQEYGMSPASWCAEYACSWVWRRTGLTIPGDAQSPLGWASVGFFLNAARNAGWVVPASDIRPGDFLCFIWKQNEVWPDHVGIVEDVYADGSLGTIEGNSNGPLDVGDQVARHVRPRNWEILAVVRPPYTGTHNPSFVTPPSAPTSRAVAPYLRLSNGVNLSQGSPHHDLIATYQARLVERGWHIGVDGLFGPQTDSITRQFQHEKNIAGGADGVVGQHTWTAAWEAPITP